MFDANTGTSAGQPGEDLPGIDDAAEPGVDGGNCIDRDTGCGVDARARTSQARPHGHTDPGYRSSTGIDAGIDFDADTCKISPWQARQ